MSRVIMIGGTGRWVLLLCVLCSYIYVRNSSNKYDATTNVVAWMDTDDV